MKMRGVVSGRSGMSAIGSTWLYRQWRPRLRHLRSPWGQDPMHRENFPVSWAAPDRLTLGKVSDVVPT